MICWIRFAAAISVSFSVEEFISFDACVDTCEPSINLQNVDWRQDLRARCVQSILNTSDEPGEDASDTEDDDDEDEWMDIPSEEITAIEALEMLDKLQAFFECNEEEDNSARSIAMLTSEVERMRIKAKKQKIITDFFRT